MRNGGAAATSASRTCRGLVMRSIDEREIEGKEEEREEESIDGIRLFRYR